MRSAASRPKRYSLSLVDARASSAVSKDLKRMAVPSRNVHTSAPLPSISRSLPFGFPCVRVRTTTASPASMYSSASCQNQSHALKNSRVAASTPLEPLIGADPGQTREVRGPLPRDLGVKHLARRPEVAASHRLVHPAHRSDVLLRHRPRSIPPRSAAFHAKQQSSIAPNTFGSWPRCGATTAKTLRVPRADRALRDTKGGVVAEAETELEAGTVEGAYEPVGKFHVSYRDDAERSAGRLARAG